MSTAEHQWMCYTYYWKGQNVQYRSLIRIMQNASDCRTHLIYSAGDIELEVVQLNGLGRF